MRTSRNNSLISASLIGFSLFVSTADASDPAISTPQPNSIIYGVDAGFGETDNVSLVPVGQRNQTIGTADFDFAIQQTSRLYDANLKGDFNYLDFLEHAYSPELIGRFDGIGHVAIIPEKFTWTFQDNFGQGQLNAFAAPTPDNRENINYVSTGPSLLFRFGGTGYFDVNARFARAQYSGSPFDSNRIQGDFELGELLSARSEVSLDGETERVLFDNRTVNSDFDRSSGYAHYEINGARTEITANLGATEIDQSGTSLTGVLAKFQVVRKVSPASSVNLSVGRELTDASTGFTVEPTGAIGAITAAPAAVTGDSYTSNYGLVGWTYSRNRTAFAFTGRWERDSYPRDAALDVSRGGGEFNLEEHLSYGLIAQVVGSIYKTDYAHADYELDQGSATYQDDRIGLALTLREGRALEYRLRFDHVSRSTSDAAVVQGFHANTIFLTVGYRPRPAVAPVD